MLFILWPECYDWLGCNLNLFMHLKADNFFSHCYLWIYTRICVLSWCHNANNKEEGRVRNTMLFLAQRLRLECNLNFVFSHASKSRQSLQSLLPVGEPLQSMEPISKTLDILLLLTGKQHLYMKSFEYILSKLWSYSSSVFSAGTLFDLSVWINRPCSSLTQNLLKQSCCHTHQPCFSVAHRWQNLSVRNQSFGQRPLVILITHQSLFSVGSCQLTVNKCTDSVCQVTILIEFFSFSGFLYGFHSVQCFTHQCNLISAETGLLKHDPCSAREHGQQM